MISFTTIYIKYKCYFYDFSRHNTKTVRFKSEHFYFICTTVSTCIYCILVLVSMVS